MDLNWSAEQRSLFEGMSRFVRAKLDGDVRARDQAAEFDHAGWRALGELGAMGLMVAERWGGAGLDMRTTVGALETLGGACSDNGLMFSLGAHLWTAVATVDAFGTEAQRERWLTGLARGAIIGANAMTEPSSGSDAFSLSSTAIRTERGYRLRGSKCYVTNGPVADLFVVYAQLAQGGDASGVTAFLVERGQAGLVVGAPTQKMGLRTSPMCDLFLDDCELGAEALLGREGAGATVFNHAMTLERGAILAPALGAMTRTVGACVDFARSRAQFGKPVGAFQAVSHRIVDMHLRVEAARAATLRFACRRDAGKQATREAAEAKLVTSEAWVRNSEDAIRTLGGAGYLVETGLERELRDAMGACISSGTSDIQRRLIAGLLGLPTAT